MDLIPKAVNLDAGETSFSFENKNAAWCVSVAKKKVAEYANSPGGICVSFDCKVDTRTAASTVGTDPCSSEVIKKH